MADVLTGQQVAQVVSYIAPGFLARTAYLARFPRREPQQFTLLVWAVVISLPLVAVTARLARIIRIDPANVTAVSYVALLLGLSLFAGYIAAMVRGSRLARLTLGRIGLVYQPEQSIYAQTLLGLPPDAVVTISFTDGRKLSGTPRLGPGGTQEDIAELYLTHPAWWNESSNEWVETGAGGGVIAPLRNVHSITLDRDAILG
jgi:hypothetical protein